jgi:acetyl-CoA synthetase
LCHRLFDSAAKVVVTDRDGCEHLGAVRDRLPALATVVSCEPAASSVELDRLIAASAPRPVVDTAADDPAMILYTSGTTGAARGALHGHRFLPGRLSSFELTHRLEAAPSRDRPFFTPADWSWVAGLVDSVFTPWVFGCPVLAWRHRGFAPRAMMELAARARVRSMFLPPTALNLLRQAARPGDRWPRVDSVHSAGEPLAPATYAWAAATFGRVFDLYGMTEIGAIVGSSPWVPVRPGAMGQPYPGHDVTLVDDRGDPITGPGEGEIAVSRSDPGLFQGYFGDPEATAARFRGDWMVTGDLARRDLDGYLWHLGRRDDLVSSAGYRIGPTEVESVLALHPAVARAAVVGAPDPERGQLVKAFVLLAAGVTPSPALADELTGHVKAQLAAYAAPRRVVFVHSLPMTVSGKVRRIRLREPDADQRFGIA